MRMTSTNELLRGWKAWHVGHWELTVTREIPDGLSMKRSIEHRDNKTRTTNAVWEVGWWNNTDESV